MKANRKFVESREAVSAVIGVILMVAITVAIAAVVYVWVTSFGGGGTPAPSMSISQDATASGGWANFTVVSASPNAKWGDLNITITGISDYSKIKVYPKAKSGWYIPSNFSSAGAVSAGDRICINKASVADSSLVGDTLRIIHVPSNSVIVTWTIY